MSDIDLGNALWKTYYKRGFKDLMDSTHKLRSVHRKDMGNKEPQPIKKSKFTGTSNFMERPPLEPPNLPMVTSGGKALNPQLPKILSTMLVKDSGMYS